MATAPGAQSESATQKILRQHPELEAKEQEIAARLASRATQIDPVSASALRTDQRLWAERRDAMFRQAIPKMQLTDASVKKVMAEWQKMRLSTLDWIIAPKAGEIRGVWGNALSELLVTIDAQGNGAILTSGQSWDGERWTCVAKGATRTEDGVTELILPNRPAKPIRLRRDGIMLVIEDDGLDGGGTPPPYCRQQGQIVGHYFMMDMKTDIVVD